MPAASKAAWSSSKVAVLALTLVVAALVAVDGDVVALAVDGPAVVAAMAA